MSIVRAWTVNMKCMERRSHPSGHGDGHLDLEGTSLISLIEFWRQTKICHKLILRQLSNASRKSNVDLEVNA